MSHKPLAIYTLMCILANKLAYTVDLVAISESPSTSNDLASQYPIAETKIYEMTVETNVTNRFATTLITSKIKNYNTFGKEATFSVVLPEKAFISEFVMEIGGKQYKAYVKEKEEAKQTYDQAVSRGQSAAHVSVSARESNRFTVSVNVEAEGKAIFYLTYEELLERKLGMYELVLNIQPGEPVKDLRVQVNIKETRPLQFVRVPVLRSGNEISKNVNNNLDPNADIKLIDKTTSVVKFNPDVTKQQEFAKELGTNQKNGLAAQFVVQYEVERDPQGGEILLNEGFFVHFFVPADVPLLPKYVVFILDTSGSMSGVKLRQLKQAMVKILTELKHEDTFSLVQFESSVRVHNLEKTSLESTETRKSAFKANPENINKAKKRIKNFDANGATNIELALKTGLRLVDQNQDPTNQPLVVFLTDGEANTGETNNDNIIKSITELNIKKAPIFTLSFGNSADKKFLEKISLQNFGFARHIYEGTDASLQLSEFYKIISSPLLNNIKFKYVSNVTEVTKTTFPIYFFGSELVVAGKLPTFSGRPEVATPFESSVKAYGTKGLVVLAPKVQKTSITSLERLWAYLTVKQLLEKREVDTNKTQVGAKALRMALKYSFVTKVTSLVVVKPNTTLAVNTEDASKQPPKLHSGFVSYNMAPSFRDHLGPGFQHGLFIPNRLRFYSASDTHQSIRIPTSRPHISYTQRITTELFNNLTTSMPWLNNILKFNGVLTTPTGSIKLNVNKYTSVIYKCDLPLNNNLTEGRCQPLAKCPQIFEKLINFETFQSYACKMKHTDLTGVCCPIVPRPSIYNDDEEYHFFK